MLKNGKENEKTEWKMKKRKGILSKTESVAKTQKSFPENCTLEKPEKKRKKLVFWDQCPEWLGLEWRGFNWGFTGILAALFFQGILAALFLLKNWFEHRSGTLWQHFSRAHPPV